MLPTLSIFGWTIATYSVVVATYVPLALMLVTTLNERQHIASRITIGAFVLGVPAGIFGARLLDLFEYWHTYASSWMVFRGAGSSIYGAFLVVLPGVFLYTRWQGVPPLRFLDAGAPAMALGEAMTRVGCFLNGCCYGAPWNGPWAVRFPKGSFAHLDLMVHGSLPADAPFTPPLHPVQLYSVAIMAIVLVLLVRQFLRPHADGAVFFAFLVAYGALRIAMVPFRTEALPSMVAFSVLFIVIGAVGWLYVTRRTPHPLAATCPS